MAHSNIIRSHLCNCLLRALKLISAPVDKTALSLNQYVTRFACIFLLRTVDFSSFGGYLQLLTNKYDLSEVKKNKQKKTVGLAMWIWEAGLKIY